MGKAGVHHLQIIKNFLPGESLIGRYANYFKLGYNAFEFVLDFGQFYNGNKDPRFHTRIITSTVYAKTLLKLLQDSLDGCEQALGVIP
jgi:Protein of unknown function (DUF3467)